MIRRFWLLAAFFSPLIFLAEPACAQKAGSAAAAAAAPHAHPVANASAVRSHAHVSSNRLAHPKPAANDSAFGPGTSFGFGSSDIRDQDLGIKALIDPATQWRLYERHKFCRDDGFASGFYLLDGGYYEPAPPSNDADQSSQPTEQDQEQDNGQREEAYAEPAPENASQQVPDIGQFVLVLRNGSQIQAVAFTRRDDHIVYITTDGLRRTLAIADLDSDSTVRLNQERGTPLQFPL